MGLLNPILGILLVALAIICLVVDRTWRINLIRRLVIRGRRASTANTPPRSLSPWKPIVGDDLAYVDSFPPLRRGVLSELREYGSDEKGEWLDADMNEDDIRNAMLPFTANYNECVERKFTATGFSIEEIKALGDFSNYAELSGVPLPSRYDSFDIDKAVARPYRPFRWNYHQTMCMSFYYLQK